MPRRVDRLLVDQHSVDNAAHLDQLLPVPAVAGKARDFARTDCADLAETDLGHHSLKAGALHTASSRAAKIIVDYFNLRPAERRQPVAHGVLKRATLTIVQHLMCRGLPHIK